MKPIGPIPPHFSASDDGQLMIGGRSAEELVEEAGGTPLFAYDNNIIGGQIAQLRAAMPDGLALYYSVSANPWEELLTFLGRYVDGFRVVSRGELEHLKRAELAGIPMTFAGPGKRDDELEAGIAAGATISVESEDEAGRAIQAAERLGIRPRLAVRVNPPLAIEGGRVTMGARPSPFGIDAERVPSLVQGLIEADADWRGLHMFLGTQCLDTEALIEAHRAIIASAGEIADSIGSPIPELNLGGGFDIPCFDGDQPLDLYRMSDALHKTLIAGPELLATTRISLELGRWLVGEAGVYLTPHPRAHRELRQDLPDHRRRGPSFPQGDRLLARARSRQLADRGREPLRRAGGGGSHGDRLPGHSIRRVRRRGHAAARRAGRPDRGLQCRRLRALARARKAGRAGPPRARSWSRGRSPRRNRGRPAAR